MSEQEIQKIQVEPLVHPDDQDVSPGFNQWLSHYGKLYPETDLIHFYETREERPKVVPNFTNTGSENIAINADADNQYKTKVTNEKIIKSPNVQYMADMSNRFAPVVKEEKKETEYRTMDWMVKPDYTESTSLIPEDDKSFYHPGGGEFMDIQEGQLGDSEQQMQAFVGNQVLGHSRDLYTSKNKYLQSRINELGTDKSTEKARNNIYEAQVRNNKIWQKKRQDIVNVYNLPKTFSTVAERKADIELGKELKAKALKVTERRQVLTKGLSSLNDLVEDLSNQLSQDQTLGFDTLNPESDEYKSVYAQMKGAQQSILDIRKNNAQDLMTLGDNRTDIEKVVEGTAEVGEDVAAGLRKGVVETVNNTWQLITEVAEFSGYERDGKPWRLETKNRDSMVYNITSVMTEYMIPFFGARALVTKGGAAVANMTGGYMAGVMMKPEQGNIIHVLNELAEGDAEILGIPVGEALASMDVTPKEDDPVWMKLRQRFLSAGVQEAALGGIIDSIIFINRHGMKDTWGLAISKIQSEKKYATLMDKGVNWITDGSVNLFANRVKRFKVNADVYEAYGLPRDQIWQKTGMYRATDGKWHFRGDYSKSKFNDMYPGSWSLNHILKSDSLYLKHPDMKNATLKLERATEKGTVTSSYDADTNTIYVYADDLNGELVQGKIWHEIQHAIDTIDGHVAGANPKQFKPQLEKERDTYIKAKTKMLSSSFARKVSQKILDGKPLNKAEQQTWSKLEKEIQDLDDVFQAKYSKKVGEDGTTKFQLTAERMYTQTQGEQVARWIEGNWNKSFNDINQPAFIPETIVNYKSPAQKQLAEVDSVLQSIIQDLKAKGIDSRELPKNEQDMLDLLNQDNPNAALLINKVITDQLAQGYHQAVIKLGNKSYGMTHVTDIHMSPTARCVGKACTFKEPSDILSVIDMVRKIKPRRVVDDAGVEKLVYTLQHKGEDAYQLVVKAQTALDSKGKVKKVLKGKNKGKTKQEHVVVTFHPIKGFDKVSVRKLLDDITDNRKVNVERQFSIGNAETYIAEISGDSLKVQQRLLGAKIGQTTDNAEKQALIKRAGQVSKEIKTNKKTNPKLSILDDIKTLEWNEKIYSKLENFVLSLNDDVVFKTHADLVKAAKSFGVKDEELIASGFGHISFMDAKGSPIDIEQTKGMLRNLLLNRKDEITARTFGDDVSRELTVDDVDWNTIRRGDDIDVEDLDTGYRSVVRTDWDDLMYRHAGSDDEPMEWGEAFDDWWNETKADQHSKVEDALISGHITERDGKFTIPESDIEFNDAEDAYKSTVMASDDFDTMLSDGDMYDYAPSYHTEDGEIFYTEREAIDHTQDNMVYDLNNDPDRQHYGLWKEYTVAHEGDYGWRASDYEVDYYNIDDYDLRASDIEKGVSTYNLPDKHWGELAGEQGGFENQKVQSWTRRHTWDMQDKQATILDEIQSDWVQDFRAQQQQIKNLSVEFGDKANDIKTLEVELRKDYNKTTTDVRNHNEHVNLQDGFVKEKRQEFFDEVMVKEVNGQPVTDEQRISQFDFFENTKNKTRNLVDLYYHERGVHNFDPDSYEDFGKWLKEKRTAWDRLKGSDSKEFLDDAFENDYALAILSDIEYGNINTEFATTRAEVMKRAFDKDGLIKAQFELQHLLRKRSTLEAKRNHAQLQQNKISKVRDLIPTPPMSDTSSYVRVNMLDQIMKSINKGDDFFGWWDGDTHVDRWPSQYSKRKTIGQVQRWRKDEFSIFFEDNHGFSQQKNGLTREELVGEVGEKRATEIELKIGESTEKVNLDNPMTTTNAMYQQYDEVMVNVMNKLLGKSGKMEKTVNSYGDEGYWKLDLTDEVKAQIMNTKHQLYR